MELKRIIRFLTFITLKLNLNVEASSQKDLQSEIFKLFLGLSDNPIDIHVLNCWNLKEQFKLVKFLSSTDTLVSKRRISVLNNFEAADLPSGNSEFRALILMDLCCDKTFELLNDLQWNKFEHMKWFFINSCLEDQSHLEEKLLNMIYAKNVRVGSQVFFISPQNHGRYLIKGAYKLSYNLPIQIEPIAEWEDQILTDVQVHATQLKRRRNLALIPIRGSLVASSNDTLVELMTHKNRHIDTPSKLNYHLAEHALYFLNATLQMSVVDTWGYPDPKTGHWPGMVGEIINDKADFGITSMFHTANRIPYIEYLSYTTYSKFLFVFRSPKLSVTNNVFVLPFTKMVWISSIVLVVLLMGVYFTVDLYEWRNTNSDSRDEQRNPKPRLIDSIQVIFSALCQQGAPNTPKYLSSRIVLFLAFLVLMLVYTSYAANIVALLQSPSNKIKTLSDLLGSRLELGVQDTVYNRYYFSHQTEAVRIEIYNRKIMNKKEKIENFFELEEGVRKIREGLFGFFFECGSGYKMISDTFNENEKCGLVEIAYLPYTDAYNSVQKNSTFKEHMRVAYFRLYETGLQDAVNRRWYTQKPKCTGARSFIPVGIIDVEPALLLLCWGFFVAISLFLVEKISHDHLNCFKNQPEDSSSRLVNRRIFSPQLNLSRFQRSRWAWVERSHFQR